MDKFKVAIEAIKGIKAINEFVSEYQVHPNQIVDPPKGKSLFNLDTDLAKFREVQKSSLAWRGFTGKVI